MDDPFGAAVPGNGLFEGLHDELGPFGSPTSDSARTAVTLATRSCLMVLFAPADYDLATLERQSEVAAERIVAHCGGRITRRALVDCTGG